MYSNRFSVSLLVASLCCSAGAASAEPMGTAFTYQGQLKQGGRPVNGVCDFLFSLWNDPTGHDIGSDLVGDQDVPGVQITNGLFSVVLNDGGEFGADALDGSARWLEIQASCPAGSPSVLLSPRQQLTPAPYAIRSESADSVPWVGLQEVPPDFADGTDEDSLLDLPCAGGEVPKWNDETGEWYCATDDVAETGDGHSLDAADGDPADAVYVDDDGNVGIGTTEPGAKLDVGTSAEMYAVRAHNTAASGYNHGVFGKTDSDNGYGVYGAGFRYGVCGVATPTGPYTNSYGVRGIATVQGGAGVYGKGYLYGVQGYSSQHTGVYGNASAGNGRAVYGYASHDTGRNYGVYGNTASTTDGYGVYSQGRFAATGTKSLQIDHPLDPANKYLNHYCTESPEPILMYRGSEVLDGDGEAWVQLPAYFEAINRDFHYQLTCIGGFAPVYIAEEILANRFKIAGGQPGLKVSWTVTGTRNDRFVQAYGAPTEKEKPEHQRGKYLHPELFGMPKELGIAYADRESAVPGGEPQDHAHEEVLGGLPEDVRSPMRGGPGRDARIEGEPVQAIGSAQVRGTGGQ